MTSPDAVTNADIVAKLQQPLPAATGVIDRTPVLMRQYVAKQPYDGTAGITKNFSLAAFSKGSALTPLADSGVANLGSIRANGSFATENKLAEQMHQLETRTNQELRRVSESVERLARLLETRTSEQVIPASIRRAIQVNRATLHEADSDSQRAELFNLIADEEYGYSEEIADVALSELQSDSPELRAAAARALALVAGADALPQLQSALNAEKNRFTASFIRAAIRAAEA